MKQKMDNRILTIDSLIEYCKKNKLSHYSSKESGKPIVVNTFGNISYSEVSDPSLMSVTLKACHCGINRNNSKITEEVMMNAFPTFANKPILAEIVEDDNGEKDFGSHSFTIESDEKGNQYTHYIEKPVGIVPETNDIHLEYDESQDKTYTIVNGYIFNYYGNETANIIKRKNGTKVSVELEIYDMAWSGKDKVLVINDFSFAGITLLGESVGEGMLGSRLDIADFSKKEIIDYSEQLIEMQERLEKLESTCFNNTNNSKEGGNENLSKFEELCQKYEKTVDDITFDYESMSDDELVEAFTKAFDEEESDNGNETETGDTPSGDGNTEGEGEEDNNPADPDPEEPSDEDDGADDDSVSTKKKVNNSLVRTYEISHEDTKYALYALLSEYETADNDWYFINSVFDDHFTYENWNGDKIFGQKYTKDGDNVAFDGERYNLHRELLTDSEFAELQSMRSNYAALKEFKETTEKNELHAKREEILANEKYSSLSENEDFKKLVENMDNYSLEELEKEAKVIFADNVSIETFAQVEKKPATVKVFANVNKSKKDNRYGNLFSK